MIGGVPPYVSVLCPQRSTGVVAMRGVLSPKGRWFKSSRPDYFNFAVRWNTATSSAA
jgi:hypothetical protein